MYKKKEGKAILKNKFYEDLILTADVVKYEKKVEELYDPEEELESDYMLVVDEELESDYWDDIEDSEDDVFNTYNVTRVEFSNERINNKFNHLVVRYENIIDRETIFGFCVDIISKYINEVEKNYIYISDKKVNRNGKFGYYDDISTINIMLDTRINREIDNWRGTYPKEINGVVNYIAPPFSESLDAELYPLNEMLDDDSPRTIGDMATDHDNIFHDKTYEANEAKLENIYTMAKLTDREIEVLQALERTTDHVNGGTYTKAHAGELLDCTGQNISNIFRRVKKKVMELYRKEDRTDKIKELNLFLDEIENEKDIKKFILDNLGKNFIEYLLYETNLDVDLRIYFNKNNKNPLMDHTDTMREFCTYFIKEVYEYKTLVKYNLMMENTKIDIPAQVEPTEQKSANDDIYTYKVWHKLDERERKGKFIMIDNEKYYYVKQEEQKPKEETKGIYLTETYLKR